jgi:hypothetical protein
MDATPPESPGRKRPAGTLPLLVRVLLGLCATRLLFVGLAFGWLAMIYVEGYEQIPQGPGQQLLWLVLPLMGLAASGWALAEALWRNGSGHATRPRRRWPARCTSDGTPTWSTSTAPGDACRPQLGASVCTVPDDAASSG